MKNSKLEILNSKQILNLQTTNSKQYELKNDIIKVGHLLSSKNWDLGIVSDLVRQSAKNCGGVRWIWDFGFKILCEG